MLITKRGWCFKQNSFSLPSFSTQSISSTSALGHALFLLSRNFLFNMPSTKFYPENMHEQPLELAIEAATASKARTLLSLPAELRNIIWALVLGGRTFDIECKFQIPWGTKTRNMTVQKTASPYCELVAKSTPRQGSFPSNSTASDSAARTPSNHGWTSSIRINKVQ